MATDRIIRMCQLVRSDADLADLIRQLERAGLVNRVDPERVEWVRGEIEALLADPRADQGARRRAVQRLDIRSDWHNQYRQRERLLARHNRRKG